MKLIKIPLVLSFLSVIFLTVACEDTENTPESGTISGVITFLETWPETGTISISLNTSWPPTGAPYAFKTIESDDLNANNEYSYSFENVAFDAYKSIVVSWQDPTDTNSATNQHALGAYGGITAPYFMDATSITVSVDNHEELNLDFSADLSLIDETVPSDSGTISGVITFIGELPQTGTISITLNSAWPPQGAPYAFKTIEMTDLNSDNQYSYSFENIAFGIYASIIVSWQDPDDLNPMTNQYTLGAHGGTDPTAVTVSETEYELTGLDFGADLSLAASN